MKRLVLILFCFFWFYSNSVSVSAVSSGCYQETVSGNTAALYDLDGSLLEREEKELFPLISEAVRETGFSICVVIIDNIGEPKTDAQTIDCADLLLESFCGIDGDGILLLINNDTKYDWISTSGRCINIFTDRKIEWLFDDFHDEIKSGNYHEAVSDFVKSVKRYSENKFFEDFFGLIVMSSPWWFLFPTIFTIAFVSNVKARYALKPQKGAGNYVLTDSVRYNEKKDVFLRTYVRVESSSSGSHSSGYRSSTHRSSSGGRHGGGGRRR